MNLKISQETDNPTINLVLDTLKNSKQALVFVNTKSSSEKTAEEISKKILGINEQDNQVYLKLSEEALSSLSKPTKQCERLANCLKKGIAFHHAGLTHDQKELIEDNFRNGIIRIICSTPTLALGLDLPAFRAIIKDLKRYGRNGLAYIPILEIHQMFGRAGRPKYDNEGQAICIAGSKSEKEKIEERYIDGKPEAIESKLASEPALRTYLLSLIASDLVNSKKEIYNFFKETFYAFQYKGDADLINKINSILDVLEEWEFIISNKDDFQDASELGSEKYKATIIGKRVSELYIDPYSAHFMIECIKKSASKKTIAYSFIQMISHTLEMRPLLRVRMKEIEKIQAHLVKYGEYIMEDEPSLYDPEYEEFLNAFKTSLMLINWMDEKDEEYLMEEFEVRPGELRQKLDIGDWLLFCAEEFAKILHFQIKLKEIIKARIRIKHGIRMELIPLVQLKNIGRVRARRLFFNDIKDIGEVKKADYMKLVQILGKQIALDVKKQVGQDFAKIEVKENKRKGQISLKDY